MRRATRLLTVTLLAFMLHGCSSNLRSGALIGAGAGAAVGAIASGSARGAIIGAAIGGAAGAAIGGIMDAQAEDLQDKLPNAKVERVGEGIAITFDSGILFDVNSSQMRSAAQTNLRDLVASLEEYDGTEVLVVGHTDGTGEVVNGISCISCHSKGMRLNEDHVRDVAMADLTAFLVYLAEPAQLQRQKIGVFTLAFLIILTLLCYVLKKEYWRDVH